MKKSIVYAFGGMLMSSMLLGCSHNSASTDAPLTVPSGDSTTYITQSGGANEADRGKEIGFVY